MTKTKKMKFLGVAVASAAVVSLTGGAALAQGAAPGPFGAPDAQHHGLVHGFADDHLGRDGHFAAGGHAAQSGSVEPGTSAVPDHHFNGPADHGDQSATFAQRKAEIVQALTNEDSHLQAVIAKLQSAAAADPSGWQAQVLPHVVAKEQQLSGLITAVKAANDWQELHAAFQSAEQGAGAPSAPTVPSVPTAPSAS
ncbi:MAG: hypothetical protein FWE71_01920 [Nocardioidaceae bacterium]|nr:hypothetical protein [Nocardioidaceae bacterium]MCL2613857.1 hypothetical protein [Nocardioidaceae bacterium]